MVDLTPAAILQQIISDITNISGGINNKQEWLPVNEYPDPWTNFAVDTGNQSCLFGNWVEIANAAKFPTDQVVINKLFPNDVDVPPSADDVYEFELGIGLAGFEVGISRLRFEFDETNNNHPIVPIDWLSPIIPPATRIAIRSKRIGASPERVFFTVGYYRI